MNAITTLEIKMLTNYLKNVQLNLILEKELVEKHFDWIKLTIVGEEIKGSGYLMVNDTKYEVSLEYKPSIGRFDRIWIKGIQYHPKIHLYNDNTLCLYHPKIDTSPFRRLPLVTIIPWISEWCVHYEEWNKYGVWLGKEIEH